MKLRQLAKYQQKLLNFCVSITEKGSLNKQLLLEWLKQVLEDAEIGKQQGVSEVKNLFESQFQSWVEQYLQQVLQIESDKVSKVQLQHEECIDFLQWVLEQRINSAHQDNQYENPSFQEQNEQNPTNKEQSQSNNPQSSTEIENKEQNSSSNQHRNPLPTNSTQKISKASDQQLKPNTNQLSQIDSESARKLIDRINSKNPTEQDQAKLPEPDDRYKEYLQTIFEHYCKVNFGLAKDNTFEDLQKHVTIITINKFMIFTNDFEIHSLLAASADKRTKQKTSKIHIRNQLIDIFKKNSSYHKQMNFDQFLQTLFKISEVCFSRLKQHQEISSPNAGTKFSYEMIKLIKYMQIQNFKSFKQKMAKLNINFSLKFSKNLQEKKLPLNYKFKFHTESLENLQKYKQPQQNRINLPKQGPENSSKPPLNRQLAKPPLNPKMSTPNIPTFQHQRNIKQKQLYAKNPHANNQRQESNAMSFNKDKKTKAKSFEKPKIITNAPYQNQQNFVQQGLIEGYTNIHLAKKGLLFDPTRNLQGPKRKREFQLNNVIEEARKQTQAKVYYDYQDSRSGRALSNISSSKPLSRYSRPSDSNQSYRNQQKDQQIQVSIGLRNQGNIRILNNQSEPRLKKPELEHRAQLEGVIDFNDSDEDEYLDQHLKKEKNNQTELK